MGKLELQNQNVGKNHSEVAIANDKRKVDEVRELLFGDRLKEQEKQFEDLKLFVSDQLQGLHQTFKANFDNLETYVKQEIQTLHDELGSQEVKMQMAFKKSDTSMSDFRQLQLEKNKSLLEEVRGSVLRHMNDTNRQLKFLADTKLARSQMSELLSSWALSVGYSNEESKDAH